MFSIYWYLERIAVCTICADLSVSQNPSTAGYSVQRVCRRRASSRNGICQGRASEFQIKRSLRIRRELIDCKKTIFKKSVDVECHTVFKIGMESVETALQYFKLKISGERIIS